MTKENDARKISRPLYFSRIEFRQYSGVGLHSILFLNTVEQQLSYQLYDRVLKATTIHGERSYELNGKYFSWSYGKPGGVLKSWKGGYKKQLLPESDDEILKMSDYFSSVDNDNPKRPDWKSCCFGNDSYKVVYSKGINILDEMMPELLSYCDARDFEPFRNRKMDLNDKGWVGYRDELDMSFTGITNSYIPKLSLPMDLLYDEDHIWPSEKLYQYLVATFFPVDKKRVGFRPSYDAGILYTL